MPVYGTFNGVSYPQNKGEGKPPEKGASHMYEIEFVRGHVEVYLDGAFCFSADTMGEAEREIALLTA